MCVCGGGGGCVRKKTAVVVSAVVVVISDDVTVSTLSGGTARTRHVDTGRVLIVTSRGFLMGLCPVMNDHWSSRCAVYNGHKPVGHPSSRRP